VEESVSLRGRSPFQESDDECSADEEQQREQEQNHFVSSSE
jgi:hypothetical protein